MTPVELGDDDLELEEVDAEEDEEDLDHGRRGRLRPHSPGLLRLLGRILLAGFRLRAHLPRRRR